MTDRRYDLAPEETGYVDAFDEFGNPDSELVPAAGHLGVQEAGCPGGEHLIGVDGGYCLHCRAAV